MTGHSLFNFSSISTTSTDLVSNLAIFIFYCLVVMFTLFYDQKHISRGIRNIAPIHNIREKRHLTNILNLLISYVFITWYAAVMANLLFSPFITLKSAAISPEIHFFLFVFVLSSGVIIRWVYVLSSAAFGSVLWDFYAIPGIFVTFYGLFTQQIDYPFLQAVFKMVILACIIGVIAEMGLVQLRRNVRDVLERDRLHEVLELIPLKSKVISGRNELYVNLATLLEKGVVEKKNGRKACGTSVFFESDDEERYNSAVKSFIGKGEGEIQYVGPLAKQKYYEDEESWKNRKSNIESRGKLGIKIRDYPVSFDSFRFLIVNQRHISIEFPMPPHPIHLQKYPRSVIAISFENGVIASMFQALFDVMWNNAKENVEE